VWGIEDFVKHFEALGDNIGKITRQELLCNHHKVV
jgi:hypothetical protein